MLFIEWPLFCQGSRTSGRVVTRSADGCSLASAPRALARRPIPLPFVTAQQRQTAVSIHWVGMRRPGTAAGGHRLPQDSGRGPSVAPSAASDVVGSVSGRAFCIGQRLPVGQGAVRDGDTGLGDPLPFFFAKTTAAVLACAPRIC